MGHHTRNARPSAGEIAFRFVAGTGIALALYGAPASKRDTAPGAGIALQADEMAMAPVVRTSAEACPPARERERLADATPRGTAP